MEKFSVVKNSVRTKTMSQMQKWVEVYICAPNSRQNVVKNRKDDLGNLVTQLMYDNKNRWAHVCPFIRDSLDYDLFWIEESDLDGENPSFIEDLLLQQISGFKKAPPEYDPIIAGKVATLPVLWKTFLTFFPKIRHDPGYCPVIDTLHRSLKPKFIKEGLMLGQFYWQCPEEAIYNKFWKGPLTAPYAAFAIRYMAIHDESFLKNGDEPEIYKLFFPENKIS